MFRFEEDFKSKTRQSYPVDLRCSLKPKQIEESGRLLRPKLGEADPGGLGMYPRHPISARLFGITVVTPDKSSG